MCAAEAAIHFLSAHLNFVKFYYINKNAYWDIYSEQKIF